MKFVGWLIVLAALGHAFYSGAMAFWERSQMAAAVDLALDAQLRRAAPIDPAASVHQAVRQAAQGHRIPLKDDAVRVAERDRALTVVVSWSHPVLIVRGEPALAIPLWVERSVTTSTN